MAEANDITLHLNPMKKYVQALEETEFSEFKPLMVSLMHVVCLLWANSRYYCQSSRITVLLRQICNLIIQQAKRYLDPSSIFQSDIDEAMQRLLLSINILKSFRELFDNCRSNIANYFKRPKERPPILWNFHPNTVFSRYNAFLERLRTIEWLTIF